MFEKAWGHFLAYLSLWLPALTRDLGRWGVPAPLYPNAKVGDRNGMRKPTVTRACNVLHSPIQVLTPVPRVFGLTSGAIVCSICSSGDKVWADKVVPCTRGVSTLSVLSRKNPHILSVELCVGSIDMHAVHHPRCW